MQAKRQNILTSMLCLPELAHGLTAREWDTVVREARHAGLLARLGDMLDNAHTLGEVPDGPRAHLQAAQAVARAQHAQVTREVALIAQTLRPLGIAPILLKGAAYLFANLPAARGRVFSDIDILVPKARLPEVEASLMASGWASTHHSAYDQKYYRQWMHELPPMQHIFRDTVLDVHHTILPETARLKPDAAKLFAAACDVEGTRATVRVLAPTDMVLHSMTHLFHNDELSHGLRDLSDIDLLLRHFGVDPAFWPRLVRRAAELDLARPLYYGLRHAQRVFATPAPDGLVADSASNGPGWPLNRWMDTLWSRALRPPHRSASDVLTGPALFMLYLRAHWLRMPPPLLVRHLSIKAWQRSFGDGTTG